MKNLLFTYKNEHHYYVLESLYTHQIFRMPLVQFQKELLEEELDRFLFEWTTSPNRFEEKQPWLF